MKITYGEREEAYFITLSQEESVTVINADNIVDVREYFIEHMTRLFNDAVNKQLKSKFEE